MAVGASPSSSTCASATASVSPASTRQEGRLGVTVDDGSGATSVGMGGGVGASAEVHQEHSVHCRPFNQFSGRGAGSRVRAVSFITHLPS